MWKSSAAKSSWPRSRRGRFRRSASRGLDAWKRQRLIGAGADLIITDYVDTEPVIKYLFDS